MPTQAERTEATRGRLIATARRLFAEQGFADTSTEEILKEAAVSRGALYHHFPSKTDLFQATFEQVEDELTAQVLQSAAAGGETVVVDGFAAAAALRDTDPVSFAVLTSTPIPFAYVDKETLLTACQPLIALNPRGRISCVRLNNRSMQPVRLPYAKAEAFYAAYRAWAAIVARPEFALGLRLAPGDCLVFDNTRILHARTAFAPAPSTPPGPSASPGSGERHLQGCYADLDGLLSTLAVLRRDRPTSLNGLPAT